MAPEQPIVDQRAGDDARGGHGEQAAEARRCHAVAVDEQKRRNVDVGEQAGENQPVDQRKAGAHPIGQRTPVAGGDRRRRQAAPHARVVGFDQHHEHEGAEHDAEGRERGIDQPPGSDRKQACAQRRSDQRRGAEHDRDGCKLQPRLAALEHVADDRARQHGDRPRAGALYDARDDQHHDRRRERAADRRQGEKRKPGQQHGLAAEPVGERADGERRGRKSDEEDGDRGGRLSRTRAEIRLDQTDARKGHVGRERRNRRKAAEQRSEPPPVNIERHPFRPARASRRSRRGHAWRDRKANDELRRRTRCRA